MPDLAGQLRAAVQLTPLVGTGDMRMIAGTVPVKAFFVPGNLTKVFVGGFARRIRAVASPPGPLVARPSNAGGP